MILQRRMGGVRRGPYSGNIECRRNQERTDTLLTDTNTRWKATNVFVGASCRTSLTPGRLGPSQRAWSGWAGQHGPGRYIEGITDPRTRRSVASRACCSKPVRDAWEGHAPRGLQCCQNVARLASCGCKMASPKMRLNI